MRAIVYLAYHFIVYSVFRILKYTCVLYFYFLVKRCANCYLVSCRYYICLYHL